MLAALPGAAHADYLMLLDFPSIEVEGSHHQHVGLSQTVTASAERGDAQFVLREPHVVHIPGDKPETRRIDFVAPAFFAWKRREFVVQVGRETSSPLFELRHGNQWTYEVEVTGGRTWKGEETLEVVDRRVQGPLHVVHLRFGNSQAHVYALDGQTYLLDKSPVFLISDAASGNKYFAPAAAEPPTDFRFAVFAHSRCDRMATPDRPAIELSGPAACRGHDTQVGANALVPVLLSAGVLTPFVAKGVNLDYRLVSSKRGTSPAFEIPTRAR